MESSLRHVFALLLLCLSAAPVLADDFKALPPGPGRDVMVRVCSQCHSPEVAATQALDAGGWKAVVDQMANNGANATDAEFDTITQYLTKAFPPK
jgi:competence protein ComEA